MKNMWKKLVHKMKLINNFVLQKTLALIEKDFFMEKILNIHR